jgi:hypothetical protein
MEGMYTFIQTVRQSRIGPVVSAQTASVLISSSAEIGFRNWRRQIAFTVADLRPITVELGGLPPGKIERAVNRESRPFGVPGPSTLALPASGVTIPEVLSALK